MDLITVSMFFPRAYRSTQPLMTLELSHFSQRLLHEHCSVFLEISRIFQRIFSNHCIHVTESTFRDLKYVAFHVLLLHCFTVPSPGSRKFRSFAIVEFISTLPVDTLSVTSTIACRFFNLSPILNTLLLTCLRSSSQKTHCHLQNVLKKLHQIRWHLWNIHFPCRELWRNMLKDNFKIKFDQCASIQNRRSMCSDVNVCTAFSSFLKKQDCENLNTTLVSERGGVEKEESYWRIFSLVCKTSNQTGKNRCNPNWRTKH